MILILSTDEDNDTQRVIDWLHFKNAHFFRLNDQDLMSGRIQFYLNNSDNEMFISTRKNDWISSKEINCVWLRKFGFLRDYHEIFPDGGQFMNYMYSEFSNLRSLLYNSLKNKKWLFKPINFPRKLEILQIAQEIGLKIPRSIVTSNKTVLERFFKNKESLINKSMGEGKSIKFKEKQYAFYTTKIDSLSNITDTFSPSLFQEYIDKDIELRVFFIEDQFYPMAIFSQNNEKTKTDFRNYDWEKPNRLCSYQLPREIQNKLYRLMDSINLNTGSIDLIRGIDEEYYFLEVNPSGQFGMTDLPCNYNLAERISEYLIRNDSDE